MNKKIKNCLGIAIIAVLVIFALSGAVYVYFYSKWAQPSSYRSFSVSGEGKAVAVPDIARFTFSVITEGGLGLGDLQLTNTTKTNKVLEFLTSKGIDKKDIKTEGYNLTPRYQYFDCRKNGVCPPAEIVGYSVSQMVSVKIRDFAKIGELLSGVVANGANSVSELSFTIDDPTEVQNQAREEAIAKAKVKAEAVAKAGGFSLGKLLSIEEGGLYAPMAMEKSYGIGGGGVSSVPTVEPGSQEITVNMTLSFEIK
jgi:uncharacterized protein YggE